MCGIWMWVGVFDYAYLWSIAWPLNEHRAVNFVRHDDKKETEEKMKEKEEKQTKIRKTNEITTQMKWCEFLSD